MDHTICVVNTKGVDQLLGYCADDLHLCLLIWKSRYIHVFCTVNSYLDLFASIATSIVPSSIL